MAEPNSTSCPRRVWIFESNGSLLTAAEGAFQGLRAEGAVVHLQPLIDIEEPLLPAEPVSLADKTEHDDAHGHQRHRRFGAVLIHVDLFADGVLSAQHLSA